MTDRQLRPMPAQVDLPALENDVLDRWREQDIFARSLAESADRPVWVFYEGPPTANGKPGAHHAEPRVFKDVFCRYRTMRGYHVPRRGGWDCHGLPVELAVEKELGFSGKQQIEAFGIEEFNARCRESVLRHVAEHERLSYRMGYWIDQANPYRTMDPSYVESVWWSLKQIFDKGLLVEDHRVAPYCPRCGTALSDHEVAQGYQTVTDPSVYVRFPITSGDWAGRAALLVWTTTPWTLVSNTAVAVHPEVTYAVVRSGDETLVIAEPLVAKVLGDAPAEVLDRFPGSTLEHVSYARPFDLVEFPDGAATHYVGLADYVTTEDGTGLVHQAPAFGADDLVVARRYGLPVVNPVRPDGHFEDGLGLVGGLFFKAADPIVVADLRERGLLFREQRYEHSYPHCWRCDTALLYYALPSWYIRTTAVKNALLRENARTDWHPASIQTGRYGDWLENNIDWSLSRNRYWGTPLPIWRCADGHLTCVGSRSQLGELAGRDLSDLDPHRPYVDDITFRCPDPGCSEPAHRVPEVIDAWYDSGSMPFAQFGYPYAGADEFEARFPAQFIAEAIDQTRGWFYTLMAIGTLVFDRSPYETVLCLGHIVDERGLKMSKHLGNILDPFEVMEQHGADSLRWLLLCVGNPWSNRRVGPELLDEVTRKVLLTLWNTASFFVLYARANGYQPGVTPAPAAVDRGALDRWVLSELHRTTAGVGEALERFDTTGAGRLLTEFIDQLSNWYVRRSRRRFWTGDTAALATLYECLEVLTRLLAPFTPFLAEEVHTRLVTDLRDDRAPSVHLREWPTADVSVVDDRLAEQMALVRRLVELGRAARAESGVKTRQPLARALVGAAGWADLPQELRAQVAEELNVLDLAPLASAAGLVDVSVKANFRALGRRFGKGTPRVAELIAGAEPAGFVAQLREHGSVSIDVDGAPAELTEDDVVVTETPRSGWAVATEGGESLALDLVISPELRRAGLARDAIRLIQEARKTSGLDVSDRIELWWQSESPETSQALADAHDLVAEEVLAVSIMNSTPTAPVAAHEGADLGLRFWLRQAGE